MRNRNLEYATARGYNAGLARADRNELGRATAARMTAEANGSTSYRFNSRSGTVYEYRTDGSGSPI